MKSHGLFRKHSHMSAGAGVILSAMLLLGSGCGKEEEPAAVSNNATPTVAAEPTEEPVEEPKILRVGCGDFSGVYDGLFTLDEDDALVAELTQFFVHSAQQRRNISDRQSP